MTSGFSSGHSDVLQEISCCNRFFATCSTDSAIHIFHMPTNDRAIPPTFLQRLSISTDPPNSPSCVVTQLAWSDNLFLQEDLPLMMYESCQSEEDQLKFENEFEGEDNLLLAAATSDGRVIIWQWSPEREFFELETHQQLFSASISNIQWQNLGVLGSLCSRCPVLAVSSYMTGSSGWTLLYPLKTSNGSIFSWQKYQGQENIEEEGSISSIIWFQSNIIVGYLTGFIQIHRIEMCIHKETDNPVDSELLDTAEYKSILVLKAEFLGSALVCNGSFYGMALSPLTGLPFRYFAVHQRNTLLLFKIFEDEIPFSDPSGAAMSSFSVLAEFSRLLTAAAADSPRLPSPIHREQFSETIKQITWSLLGTCLFINYGERTTKCLKESLDGSWQVSIVDTC